MLVAIVFATQPAINKKIHRFSIIVLPESQKGSAKPAPHEIQQADGRTDAEEVLIGSTSLDYPKHRVNLSVSSRQAYLQDRTDAQKMRIHPVFQ